MLFVEYYGLVYATYSLHDIYSNTLMFCTLQFIISVQNTCLYGTYSGHIFIYFV